MGSATHIQVVLPTSSNSVQPGPEVCLLGESRSFKVTVDSTHRRAPSADLPCCFSRGRSSPSQGADWTADESYAVLCCGLASWNNDCSVLFSQELVEFYQQNSLKDCFKSLDTTLQFPYKEPERRAISKPPGRRTPQAGGLHSTFSGFQGRPAPSFGFSNYFLNAYLRDFV